MHHAVFQSFRGNVKQLFGFLVAVAVCFAFAQKSAYADDAFSNVEQNIRASIEVGNLLKSAVEPTAGFAVKIVSAQRKSNSPFQAVVSAQGTCILVVNQKPASWAAWGGFAADGHLMKQDSFYFAMLHEIGHCINKLAAGTNGVALPEGVDSELYADVFALVASSRLLDEQTYHQLARGVVKARLAQERWFGGKSHATGKKLQEVYARIKVESGVDLNVPDLGQISRQLFRQVSDSRHSQTAAAHTATIAIN